MHRTPHQNSMPYGRSQFQQKLLPLTDRNKQNIFNNIPTNSKKNLYQGINNLRQFAHQRNRSDYQTNNYNDLTSNITLEMLNEKINRLTLRVAKNQEGLQNMNIRNQNKWGIFNYQQINKKIEECWKINVWNKQSIQKEQKKIYQYLTILKQQIGSTNQKQQNFKTQLKEIEKHITETSKNITTQIAKNVQDFLKKYTNQIVTLKNQIQNFQNQLDGHFWTISHSFQSCSIQYPYKSIKITHHENIQVQQNHQKQTIATRVYYLDQEGYLLDENSFYLIDKEEKKIRLSNKHIELLKSIKILT